VPLARLVSRPFSGAVRDGVLALGVSSTEVAAVGLVALSGRSRRAGRRAAAGAPEPPGASVAGCTVDADAEVRDVRRG